ncbi:MAG: VWA domain-containing protein [Pyrinomonadaceae bacterium MAG19_C2-C3]|nr:VWA domain-containing protein [Pyrinomonadaceae bacterium MAG19_C2-C3]
MLYDNFSKPHRAAFLILSLCFFAATVTLTVTFSHAQTVAVIRRLDAPERPVVRIRNARGQVKVRMTMSEDDARVIILEAVSYGTTSGEIPESVLKTSAREGVIEIDVPPVRAGRSTSNSERASRDSLPDTSLDTIKRLDLTVSIPARAKVSIETEAGAVDVTGDFASVDVRTTTGTISADVPVDNLRYDFDWLASRPRIYSAVELAEAKEGSGGRFQIKGRLGERTKKQKKPKKPDASTAIEDEGRAGETANTSDDVDNKKPESRTVQLNLTTERGVVLFGVDPLNAPVDLRERQLTEAARVVLRTNDEDLIERVRRVAPKLVSEYANTLPARRGIAPALTITRASDTRTNNTSEKLMRLNASVLDARGRAVRDLTVSDFQITETNVERRITNVVAGEAPFNLVLLLDVSGSVEERLEFIRRAALAFVASARPQDRISIVSFRDDVQNISGFTTNRPALRESINDIQAGGATALYDSLAYVLLETLRPLQNKSDERTAIVVLSDGDDNRSFLSFANVNRLARESGAVIYPLYIPSGLIPASTTTRTNNPTNAPDIDPTRNRALTLTTRATEEGQAFAQTTGGIFYPITRFSDIQTAYDDVVAQLRNSYTITYATASPTTTRARVHVRTNATAQVRAGQAVAVQ